MYALLLSLSRTELTLEAAATTLPAAIVLGNGDDMMWRVGETAVTLLAHDTPIGGLRC